MKKIAVSIVLLSSLFFASSPVFAQTNMCNQRCDVDTDCGSGYRCYVGVCRLDSCPSSSSCVCNTKATATPVASMKPTATPAATSRATASPKPTGTPKPTASASGNLSHSPKTGASSWVLAGLAFVLFFAGVGLSSAQALFAGKGNSPEEISHRRRANRR